MDKETQRIAWSCLPKEFKEEVIKEWSKEYNNINKSFLEYLFGYDNIIYDAEGEDDEILYVSRKKLQYFYENLRRVGENHATFALQSLFGSKCLPDKEDVNVPQPDCKHFSDGKCAHPSVYHLENGELVKGADCDVSSCEDVEYEPKPAEPKFRCEDRVRIIKEKHPYYGKIATVDALVNGPYSEVLVNLRGNLISFNKSDLEPYTEPKENPIPSNLTELNSKEADRQFDNILKDSLAKERRLNIATTIIERIIKSEYYSLSEKYREDNIKEMVKVSLQITDAIMTECEKGGDNENN